MPHTELHHGDALAHLTRTETGSVDAVITEKPLDVVRSLVRICPEGGTALDPFAGAGTTGRACVLEGRNFIGCELTEHYAEVARRRIAEAADPLAQTA